MLKSFWTLAAVWLVGLVVSGYATETYSLADGSMLTGDILTFSDSGIKFRLGDGKYSEQMPWTQFSQEGLKQLAQNAKIRPLVEPFIELPPVKKEHASDHIKVQEVSRLDRPARQSLIGALGSSSVGCFLLALIYLANLYASFEVAVCRGRPLPVVIGVSAVLPVLGPAIFYLLPSLYVAERIESAPVAEGQAATDPGAAGATGAPAASGTPGDSGTPATAAAPELAGIQVQITSVAKTEPVVVQTYKRGQFTFNRRFMESKFAGFLQPVRSPADQNLDFFVKLPQGTYVVQRITTIGMNDFKFEVLQDGQPQEMLVPFGDIQEITLKSKPA
jgi:hypothetical protein